MHGGEGTARRIGRTLALTASMGLLVAGCGDGLGDPPPNPASGPTVKSCVTPFDDLVADLNADGTPDRVSPGSLTSDDLTITFGAGDGGKDTRVGPRDLVGDDGEEAHDVLAVVADFDQDGWNDLFVVATPEFSGDNPEKPDVSELRLGPFSASGAGQSTHPVSLIEPRALAVADYNDDRYPDLAAYGHAGDGVYSTTARLGSEDGLDSDRNEKNAEYSEYAEQTDQQTPTDMPRATPTAFHPACAPDTTG